MGRSRHVGMRAAPARPTMKKPKQPATRTTDPQEQTCPSPRSSSSPPASPSRWQPAPDHGETSYEGHGPSPVRRALITGGDSGIGRAVAIAFAREDADVAIVYLPEEQADADETAQWVERPGARACSSRPTCATSRRRAGGHTAVADLGGLDILVNNAGFQWARRSRSRTSHRGPRPDVQDEPLRAVLGDADRPRAPGRGRLVINESSIQAYQPSEPSSTTRPRRRRSTTSPSTWPPSWARADPRQRGRAGTDLDAPAAGHPARGEDREVRRGHAARASRAAGRGRARVRVPRCRPRPRPTSPGRSSG